jgi:hypothetical protein
LRQESALWFHPHLGAADSDQHGWARSRLGQYFVERLWRTVKYEDIYLKEYRTMAELLRGLLQVL